MLVSSARRPSPRSLLRGLQTWLPAIEALRIARREKPPKSAHVTFTQSGASPAWPSGTTARISDQLLYTAEVDHANIEGAALMQHYGADSDFLDCSNALDVALWFSHHDLRTRVVETSAEDWYDRWFVLQHQFSWYERAGGGTGFIYVFDVHPFENILANADLVELSAFEPGTRPAVQEAALLYADPESASRGDLAAYVGAAFSFDVPLLGLPESVQRGTTEDVFPHPSRDPVYDYLLHLPFYAKDPSYDTRLERMIALPLYADAAADESNVVGLAPFVVESRQIWPTWVYNHLLRLHGEDAHRLSADPSSLSKAEAWVLGGCTNKIPVLDLSEFPEIGDQCPHNLFVEFSPLEVTGTPAGLPRDFVVVHKARGSEEISLHRIVGTADLRAIWLRKGVLRGAQGFRFQAFYGWVTSSFRSGAVRFLRWPPGHGDSGDEDLFLLRYVLSVYCSVSVGLLRARPFPADNSSSRYLEINMELMLTE